VTGDGVLACTERQQALVKRQIDDRVAQIRAFFLRPLIRTISCRSSSESSYIATT